MTEYTLSSPQADEAARELLARPKMILHAQCGRRHFATDDLAANIRAYRRAFGLAPDVPLVGRVYRRIVNTHAVDAGESLTHAIASAEELAGRTNDE